MNRRGQLSMGIFIVIVVFSVVGSLATMVGFNGEFGKGSEGRNGILSDVSFYEDFVIKDVGSVGKKVLIELGLILPEDFVGPKVLVNEEALKSKFQEILEEREIFVLGLENYFGKVGRGEFSFKQEGEEYVFVIDDLFVYSELGANKIKRNFGFKIVFGEDDLIVETEKIVKA